jgi:hypothetical protein
MGSNSTLLKRKTTSVPSWESPVQTKEDPVAKALLLVASPAGTPTTRLPIQGRIRSSRDSSKGNQPSSVRLRSVQIPEEPKEMASSQEDQPTNDPALLLILREDQISLHRKYDRIEKLLQALADRVTKLEKKKKKKDGKDKPGGTKK